MDWDKLRIFLAVAEAGSFTRAGDTLNLSQSAVSRQIGGLEESLSVPLFHRHARGLILTEQGEELLRVAREVSARLAMAEAVISESKGRPKGLLKITATVALGSTWLTPRMTEFIDLYPEITPHMLLSEDDLDLGMREADVAIRLTPPTHPDLIRRHLMTVHQHIYASPRYIERFGEPRDPADLAEHRLIVYGDEFRAPVPDSNWLLEVGAAPGHERRPVMTVNNISAMARAVEGGLGIAALPDYMFHESERLVRLLAEIEGPSADAYFVYPEELRNSKRISVFRDFLLSKVADWRF